MTWIYEVNLEVDADVRAAYLEWLRPHVQEMLDLPCFEQADLFEDTQGQWVVQYRAVSKEAIDTYLNTYSKQMRGDGLRRFEGKFKATRRVLQHIER